MGFPALPTPKVLVPLSRGMVGGSWAEEGRGVDQGHQDRLRLTASRATG